MNREQASKVISERSRLWTLGLGLWTAFAAFAADVDVSKLPPPAARPVDFASDIKPIFEAACLRCHGTEKPKGRFSLATRDTALKGGDNGVAIIPGDSARSLLIHFVAGLVADSEMPPSGKGDPLTREQVALLRAWIDQGVVWERIDFAAQQAAQFSFTPAVRWVTVSGNAQKFQEHQWVRRGFSGGLADFRLAQKLTNGASFVAEGRAMTDDYKITLDVRKEDVGFARFGVDQFRHYYDDHGPYYPFRVSGFSSQTPNIFSLERDLHLDTGKAFAEFGLTKPGWPQIVLGYEHQYREGSKSTEEWGEVTQATSSGPVVKHIYPARQDVRDEAHILRLDVSHELAGVRFEDNLRAEFWSLDTKRTADTRFGSGQIYPTSITTTRETHDQFLVANTLRGEKPVNDWLFLSAGYLYSHLEAEASMNQSTADGVGLPARGRFWHVDDIVLDEDAHVFNLNALGGPWRGFTVSLGAMSEWSRRHGFGYPNTRERISDAPSVPMPNEFGRVASDTDSVNVEESVALRYTAIPATVLFAEARLTQEHRNTYEELDGDHDFLRDTDTATDGFEGKVGFQVSPWRFLSFSASGFQRRRDFDYFDQEDQQPHGAEGDGYPAFFQSRRTESQGFNARMVWRPAAWLKTTLSYELAQTGRDTETDHVVLQSTNLITPGGRRFTSDDGSETYSANLTVMPLRRWFLSGTVSWQESRTETADYGFPVVVPSRGETLSLLGSSTFVLSAKTDLSGSYTFSRARFGQDNFVSGLPLGIDYDLHGLQVGVTHRFNPRVMVGLQYGFYQYEEPTARGFSDYRAHLIYATLTVRLPR